MSIIQYISVHHSGGTQNDPLASGNKLTVEEIDRYHKQRWPDFKSKLGYWVGYNIVIRPDGSFVQTRLVGEEGAHTKGFNLVAVGICLIGNFSKKVDTPTISQKIVLRNIMKCLLDKQPERMGLKTTKDVVLDITKERILPHRLFRPSNTSCCGDSLYDGWSQDLVNPYGEANLAQEIAFEIRRLLSMIDILKKRRLGAMDKSCLYGDDMRG